MRTILILFAIILNLYASDYFDVEPKNKPIAQHFDKISKNICKYSKTVTIFPVYYEIYGVCLNGVLYMANKEFVPTTVLYDDKNQIIKCSCK